MPVDYRDYPVLYVDDEHANLVAIQYALEDTFRIEITTSPTEALERLQSERFAVLLADHRMPGMTGVELCEAARTISPDTTRMIITAYADLHAAIDAVNRGQVARYLRKPVGNELLTEVLRAAIEIAHASQTIHELRARILTTGTTAATQSATRDVATVLEPGIRELRRLMEYGTDLINVLSRTDDPARIRDLVSELDRTFVDATGLVDEVESVRKQLTIGTPPKRLPKIDLSRVVGNTIRLLREQLPPKVELQLVLAATPQLAATPESIAQILTHLVLNAAEAISAVDMPSITVEVFGNATHCGIVVEDNGAGVADHLRERIFDPQFSLTGGTGLGLPVARRLAETAGGTLDLQTELRHGEQGASFRVRFPTVSWDDESGEHPRQVGP